jgi:hypothetical protein
MHYSSLALLLKLLSWVGAALVLLMPLLAWLFPNPGLVAYPGILASGAAGDFAVRLSILLLTMPPYLLVAWGLVQLSGFCTKLARGNHLSRAAAAALKRFGSALVAAAVMLPVTRIAVRAYAIDIAGWSDVLHGMLRPLPILATAMGLIVGLIVIVFAAILEQATVLAEENARFV